MVKNMPELDRFPWCGHSVIMGKRKGEWQDTDYVLSWFGQDISTGRKAYRRYLQDGIDEGHKEDLVGGED
jgi:putative transposase